MIEKKIIPFIALLISITTYSQTVITNVTIVDVQNSKLINGQSVILEDSIIKLIMPSEKMKIPTHSTVINGEGKYLMPGLIDAHAHSLTDGGLYSDPDVIDLTKYVPYEKQLANSKLNTEEHFKRFLQCGITSIIDPGSTFNLLKIRDSLRQNKLLPTVFMAGPLITVSDFGEGRSNDPADRVFEFAESAENARLIVRKQLSFHPAFIKIIFVPDLSWKHIEDSAKAKLPIVKAIIDEAHKNGLKVAVHATERITSQLAVESGCDYLVHGVHDEIIDNNFIKLLQQKKTIFCPTANVEFPFYRVFTQNAGYSGYEIKHADPHALKSLFDLQDLDTALFNQYKKQWESNKNIWKRDSIRLVNLKKLSDAGITIVSGTDASSFGDLQAASYLPELLKMKQSGLSNWEIIRASTINPTVFMNRERSLGSIANGKIADMILLNKNPVEDLLNLNEIALLFKNGQMISPDTIINETPEMLVQRQWNAYNGKNLEAFLACFNEDVEVYNFPNSLLYKGIVELKKNYAPIFNIGSKSHGEIRERIISGNTIVDNVTLKGAEGKNGNLVIIYKTNNHKISSVYLIR